MGYLLLAKCLLIWVLFWRRSPEIPDLIACTWLSCYGNGEWAGLAGAIRLRVWCGDEVLGDQPTVVSPTSYYSSQLLIPAALAACGLLRRTNRHFRSVSAHFYLLNPASARRVAQHPLHLSWIFFFSRSHIVWLYKGGRKTHFGGLFAEHDKKMWKWVWTDWWWGLSLPLTDMQWGALVADSVCSVIELRGRIWEKSRGAQRAY